MKLLFFGTPEEAVPFLESCVRNHDVRAVVTRPDRPAGRGLALQSPAVKGAAEKFAVRVLQPEKPSDILPELKAAQADAAVVVAYGKLLPRSVLDATRLGFLNVHFSLLPSYRGASPMERALMNGERRSGVTVFWLDEGMDTGPVQTSRETQLTDDDDAFSLKSRMIALGVETLQSALEQIARGDIHKTPQSGTPSLAPKLSREEARLDFDRPAAEIHNRVRALAAGPRAFVQLEKRGSVQLVTTRLDADPSAPGTKDANGPLPGTVVRIDKSDGILIQCRPGRIWVVVVQPEGKRQIAAADFANGLRLKPGERIAYVPQR